MRWLGFDWGEHLYYASDYFEQLYEWADAPDPAPARPTSTTSRRTRSASTAARSPSRARNSPYRERPLEENLDLFARMRKGEFPDGARVLRAKIDMASGNINLRDPVLYRILHAAHHRTGDAWCIYPMYDFAHGQSDAIEGITHSICTLEFEDHRPLYDWFLENLPVPSRPRQIEFARLNLTHTVLSKRFLLQLVADGRVRGWDDPRMPTISGHPPARLPGPGRCATSRRDRRRQARRRRRLRDARALRARGAQQEGAAALGGAATRSSSRSRTTRRARSRSSTRSTTPRTPRAGTRKVPFSRELWIEREDFMEDPPKKFFRLAPGREVRLRYAYFVTCREVVKDAAGEIVELRCSYDPATRGGDAPDGRRPKATLHWVSARARGAGRGAALRPPLRAPRPGRRRRSARRPQPGVRGGAGGRARRAGRRFAAGRRDGAVRAARLLLPRPGLEARTGRSSTARSRSRTPGSRSRPRASRTNKQGGCCAAPP